MIYLKCGNPNGCYNDPETKWFIKGGQVKAVESLTPTMQKWLREGGLKQVDPAESPGVAGVAPSLNGEGDSAPKTVGKLETKTNVTINPKLKP